VLQALFLSQLLHTKFNRYGVQISAEPIPFQYTYKFSEYCMPFCLCGEGIHVQFLAWDGYLHLFVEYVFDFDSSQ
jgi:hypothetical protein